jgi:hypothetical protein
LSQQHLVVDGILGKCAKLLKGVVHGMRLGVKRGRRRPRGTPDT